MISSLLMAAASAAPAAAPGLIPGKVVFLVLAGLAVALALVVILHRNPVVEALALAAHLVAIAGMFLLLGATLLALIQIVVYAGAIVILITFVIMLLNLQPEAKGGPGAIPVTFAVVLGVAFVAVLGRVETTFFGGAQPAATAPLSPRFGSTAQIGEALFGPYFFPFEVVSLVLLAAMVGAVVIAKRRLED